MKKIILVSGYKRAGKDFVSTEMSQMLEGSKVMSFAEPLKDIMAITMGIKKGELEDYKNQATQLYTNCCALTDFRSILQRFGTEAMKKHFGDDVWAELLASKTGDNEITIVSDFRFMSEYKTMCKYFDNVYTVRVDDYNLVGDGHASEHDLDTFSFDYRINNTAKSANVLKDIAKVCRNILLSK